MDTCIAPPPGFCEQCFCEHGCTSIWVLAFSSAGIYLQVELLGHLVILFNVLRTSHAFSIGSFPILPNVHKGSNFSTFSPVLTFWFYLVWLDFCCRYSKAILLGVRWLLTMGLICISLLIAGVEYLFRCLLAIHISSLENCLFKPFAPLLFWIGCFGFFLNWVIGVLYIVWILTLHQIHHLWYYLLFRRLPFHSVNCVLWCTV